MCGICGSVGIENAVQAESVVRRMAAAMLHRGPDDDGFLIAPAGAPRVTFGMRRLSIIDLPGGKQPIFNERGDVAVVFNGEIYNFQRLRDDLSAAGHQFRTNSDTEVIVHGYEEWGAACVERFDGMFAIALLDMRAAPKVLLARDRMGIKPLYYAIVDGSLHFASEVRALLAGGNVPREISPDALDSYLLFGSVCEPMTLVEGVFSLPPGHRLVVGASAPIHHAEPRAYWSFTEVAAANRANAPKTLTVAAQELRPILERAVSDHLIADVPLGVFLSGGLDSTAIVSLASKEKSDLQTFTVVFPEQEFSEAKAARTTAAQLGTHHEELLLDAAEMLEQVDEAVASLDQPSMDGINSYFVSRAARKAGLKVALSGVGGDEIFGGYSTFASGPKAGRLAAIGRKLPRSLRAATAPAVGRVGGRGDAGRKVAALWQNSEALPDPYFFTRTLFTPDHVSALRGASRSPAKHTAPWRKWLTETAREASTLDSFAAISCMESRSYMVNTLLRDTDAVSMAHSLEVRVPLLDHLLVHFVAGLPAAAKQKRGVSKALLVEALRDVLPQEIIAQRKRTFTFPWERWLRGPLGERIGDGFSELAPALVPHMDAGAVRSVWLAFEACKTSWSRPWSLYVLNQWCRAHLTAESAGVSQAAAAS